MMYILASQNNKVSDDVECFRARRGPADYHETYVTYLGIPPALAGPPAVCRKFT